jgi:hypothetical protein
MAEPFSLRVGSDVHDAYPVKAMATSNRYESTRSTVPRMTAIIGHRAPIALKSGWGTTG